MKIIELFIKIIFPVIVINFSCKQRTGNADADYSGSESCIQCHERFYKLWSPSHHGKAMQPVTKDFLVNDSIHPSQEFIMEGKTYHIELKDSILVLVEKSVEKISEFEGTWALGGKNVIYFLTPVGNGKLQTLPLAYDIRKKEWYNNPQSAVRHFPEGTPDEALPWKDRMYTFNTSCYSCHVSQLSSNFDIATDSYQTTWREPGINCETCHGPSAGHVKVCLEAKKGETPADLKIIITKHFTSQQHNSSCAPCHAKMQPITAGFTPGERFFDHFNLTTIENADFFPDGRDLGENYTYTGWLMSKCVQSSELHCVKCHTSSGRNKYRENPNNACLPCHEKNVNNVVQHSQHPEGSSGTVCINCHMPKSEFGRMIRSDHSIRPPMPEATILFGSPNACNGCHNDKSPEWANQIVIKRKNGNYQVNTIEWAKLLKKARNGDWSELNKILEIIQGQKQNEVVITSFLRTLSSCNHKEKWPAIMKSLEHSSPLVRSAAAIALTGNSGNEVIERLINACDDEYRLVRIAAAIALARFPWDRIPINDKDLVTKAIEEYKVSLVCRPDDWSAHYNLGIFHQDQGNINKAIESYETAARLYPESLMPMINSSVLYSYIGNLQKAEENLRKALSFDPDNEAANLNLGLLLAEAGKVEEARAALLKALAVNPGQATAAYNLSVISAKDNLESAISYARQAATAAPEEPKYAYTLAYYQVQAGKTEQAKKVLRALVQSNPEFISASSLLVEILVKEKRIDIARKILQEVLRTPRLTSQDREIVSRMLNDLELK